MVLTIRPATEEDALWVGNNLRPDDAREVAVMGQTPEGAVLSSLRISNEAYTIRLSTPEGAAEKTPCLIFGRHQVDGERSVVWMLCTKEIARAPLSILREMSAWADHWMQRHGTLFNFVDERNSLPRRWLQLLGFTIGHAIQINDHPFRYFSKCAT